MRAHISGRLLQVSASTGGVWRVDTRLPSPFSVEGRGARKAMLSRTGLRPETGVADRAQTGFNAIDGVLSSATAEGTVLVCVLGFAVTSICTPRSPAGSLARAHAHSSTVRWDSLSSLPPLRRGVKLGLLRVGVSTPLPRPRGYSSVIASIRHDASRWCCSRPAGPATDAMRLPVRALLVQPLRLAHLGGSASRPFNFLPSLQVESDHWPNSAQSSTLTASLCSAAVVTFRLSTCVAAS
jgi:hypothetical protein